MSAIGGRPWPQLVYGSGPKLKLSVGGELDSVLESNVKEA